MFVGIFVLGILTTLVQTFDIIISAEIVSALRCQEPNSNVGDTTADRERSRRPQDVAKPAQEPEKHDPPVPINKTIQTDYIVSLEDGRQYKSLKR